MSNIKWIFMLGISLIAGMIGCKKGDAGPAGPVGPAGPDSVVYSSWISLNPTYNSLMISLFEQALFAPSITKSILDSGIILSYINLGTSDKPDVVPVSSLNYLFAFEEFVEDSIYIQIYPVLDPSGLPYRYVTIPGF